MELVLEQGTWKETLIRKIARNKVRKGILLLRFGTGARMPTTQLTYPKN